MPTPTLSCASASALPTLHCKLPPYALPTYHHPHDAHARARPWHRSPLSLPNSFLVLMVLQF